ncbi:aspartate/glutamate racemase family protein [Virgibacillus sp. W0181]|uniref:aspartate/glutamate racemase family protein n=1 Tax=Virgibacillus sp. W0181 TaxID=3391581 RepID=UPI003F6DFFB4
MTAKIGILMLDTQFHRPVGDIGNQQTFPFPVVYKKIQGASISRVVNEADPTLLEPFIQASKELEEEGIKAITTSCGFLAIYQKEIQEQLTVPFFSSSLLQIPLAESVAGGPIAVITASKGNLSEAHLRGVHAHKSQLIVEGMDDMPAFSGAIIKEEITLDEALVREEMKQVIERIIKNNPTVRAIVLECTNMPPYKEAIREVTSIPIFDITTLVNYMYQLV